jgi:hypothetical protein
VSWQGLEELARRERNAVAAERWDDLIALQDDRRRLLATLESPLPPEAKSVLELALEQSRATEEALQVNLQAAGEILAGLRRGRRMVAAYDPGRRGSLEARA